MQGDRRVKLIEELKTYGVTVKAESKIRTAKYTRLYSNTKVGEDWENLERVSEAMMELFKNPKYQKLLEVIWQIGEGSFI